MATVEPIHRAAYVAHVSSNGRNRQLLNHEILQVHRDIEMSRVGRCRRPENAPGEERLMAQLVWKDTPMDSGPSIPTSLTPAETEKLRELASGKVVLEIGSAYGYSAIHMAQAGAQHVFAVDPHAGELPNSLAVMRDNLVIHGVADQVTILLGMSQIVLPALNRAGAMFGFVFVDGNHNVAVRGDVDSAFALAPRVAVHDYGEDTFPEIQAACDECPCDAVEVVDTLWIGCR